MNLILTRPSLALRTALVTSLIVMVCMALFGSYALNRLRAGIERSTSEQQFSAVSLAARTVENDIDERVQSLAAVAGMISPTLLADASALQLFLDSRPGFGRLFNAGVFFANVDGVVLASVPKALPRVGVSFREHGYMRAALQEGRATISPPMMGKLVTNQIVVMATPVKSPNGRVIGALMGVIDLDKPNFLDTVGSQNYGKTGGFMLVCRYPFTVLSSANKARSPPVAGETQPLAGQFGRGREGSGIYLDASGTEVLSSIKSIAQTDWYLVAQLPTQEAFEAVGEMRTSILLAVLFFSALAGGIAWWYLIWQWSPVSATLRQLRAMADGSRPMAALGGVYRGELGELIRGVNRVLEALDQRESALARSEAFRRAILDSVQAGIAVLDRHGVILAVNAPWVQFARQNAAYLASGDAQYSGVGANYLAIFEAATEGECAAAAGAMRLGMQEVMAGRQQSFTFEYPCHSSDEQRWFQTVVTPLNLPEVGVVVSHINITDRVQADLARAESEELFSHFMRALPAAAHIKDEAGRYLYVNPISQRLLGDELWQGKTADQYFSPDISDQCHRSDAEAMLLGSSVFEEDIRGVDGVAGSFSVNKFKIVRANKPPLLGCISLDITQLKKTQEALTIAKAQADSANIAKSRFLAFVSHDLRQPLSALSLFIHVLKGRIEPQNREMVAHVEACCTSLSSLLTDLLDFSKLESGLVNPNLSRFDLGPLLRHMGDVYGALAADKGLQLRLRLNGLGTLTASTDQGLLARMVGNFLANALEHTSAGGVLLALRYRQGRHWIEVWDSGEGISPKRSDLIDQEFALQSSEGAVHGSGLGLAMVTKTAALLRLKVRMKSRLGRGSMFAVEVPLALPLATGRLVAAPAPALEKPHALRIALVDDHDNARLALSLSLEAAGHRVIAASTGTQLLSQLGNQAPDLVIADNRLHGGETGLQVIERVRSAIGAHLPAVVISGDTDPNLESRLNAQRVALRVKPLKWPEMEAFLRTVRPR